MKKVLFMTADLAWTWPVHTDRSKPGGRLQSESERTCACMHESMHVCLSAYKWIMYSVHMCKQMQACAWTHMCMSPNQWLWRAVWCQQPQDHAMSRKFKGSQKKSVKWIVTNFFMMHFQSVSKVQQVWILKIHQPWQCLVHPTETLMYSKFNAFISVLVCNSTVKI